MAAKGDAAAAAAREVVKEAPRAAVALPAEAAPAHVRQYTPFEMAQRGLVDLFADAVAKGAGLGERGGE